MAKSASLKKSRQSKKILLGLPTEDSRFFRQLQDGITNTLSTRDWTLSFVDLSIQEIPWDETPSYAGMILCPQNNGVHSSRDFSKQVKSLIRSQYPVVFCEQCCRGVKGDLSATDYMDLAYRLTYMLCERGHRNIVFAGTAISMGDNIGMELQEGYRSALNTFFTPEKEPCFVRVHGDQDEYDPDVLLVMAQRESATAFFCTSPKIARHIDRQLIRLGYSVGESIELASMDDEGVTEEYGTPLLRVKRSAYDLGVAAAELMLARVAHPESPFQEQRIKAGPVITGTTGNTIERPRMRFEKRL